MNTISQRKLFEGIADITEPVEVVRNDRATGQMTKLGVWVPALWSIEFDTQALTGTAAPTGKSTLALPLRDSLRKRPGARAAFDAATPAPSGSFNPVPKPGGGKKR